MYRANSRQAGKTDTNRILVRWPADREFSWQRPCWYW